MGSVSNKLWPAIGIIALVCYCWLAAQIYISHLDPVGFQAWKGPFGWLVGPSAGDLVEVADEHIKLGLDLLNDRSMPPAERLGGCRAELQKAEGLLLRSLRVQPAQAKALARLAAVRWELSPPLTEQERSEHLRMIALASTMAPTAPKVQMQLGELLLKMGRRQEAVGYFAKAIDLNHGFSQEVIALLGDNLFGAEEIHETLPKNASVLVALQQPYFDENKATEYVDLIEEVIRDRPHELTRSLLSSYGRGCLKLGNAERLRIRMNALPPSSDAQINAARLEQLSRASLALGQPERALTEARRALEAMPGAAYLARHLGEVAISAGEPQIALDAFRASLRTLSREAADPAVRAELYRMIGQAEELRGDPGRAYDAYRMALELDPDESHARERVAEMERAAGLASP